MTGRASAARPTRRSRPGRSATSTNSGSAISRRGDERQRLGRRAVEQVGVVDERPGGRLLARPGQQGERRRAETRTGPAPPSRSARATPSASACGTGRVDLVEQRAAAPPRGPRTAAPAPPRCRWPAAAAARRPAAASVEQGALADAGLTAQHQHPALPEAGAGEQRLDVRCACYGRRACPEPRAARTRGAPGCATAARARVVSTPAPGRAHPEETPMTTDRPLHRTHRADADLDLDRPRSWTSSSVPSTRSAPPSTAPSS